MAQYPPPPSPGQPHYNPVYAEAPGHAQASKLHGPQSTHHDGEHPSSPYSKLETSQDTTSQLQRSLAQELRRHNVEADHMQAHIGASSDVHDMKQSPVFHPAMASIEATNDSSRAANRLRKACDSCSIRKVKCDETGPPCRACAALDIPCTFQRPTKRRGPPNRHAESIKRQRLDDPSYHSPYTGPPSPASPTHAAQALAALSSHTSVHDVTAESICPLDTLNLLIDDFFTYIHPLCPFPHEPSFREAWKRREDLSNKSFLALLASMIAALVASFPRKPRLDLEAQRKERLFPNHMSLVHRCQHICALARGPAYLDNEHLSVYDAATSYFLALTSNYTKRWRSGRLHFGECLTIIRVLGFHRSVEDVSGAPLGLSEVPGDGMSSPTSDEISVEIGRRIFWTVYVGFKTLEQVGAMYDEILIPPPTSRHPYPPMPLEVDDIHIYPDHIDPQPIGPLPMMAGFNANVRTFSSYDAVTTEEMRWQLDHKVDYGRQKRVLRNSLRQCKDILSSLPTELNLDFQSARPGQRRTGNIYGFSGSRETARSLLSLHGGIDVSLLQQDEEERRHMQYEIQKANIYASSLSTRAYIVEKYWNLVEAQARSRAQPTPSSAPTSPSLSVQTPSTPAIQPTPTSNYDSTAEEFFHEREQIVKDLLIVISSIDQVNMEPNGESFILKIRSIASMLLDAPDSTRGRMEIQTKEYLSTFLQLLIKLERASSTGENGTSGDGAAGQREWNELKEHQAKFVQQDGVHT